VTGDRSVPDMVDRCMGDRWIVAAVARVEVIHSLRYPHVACNVYIYSPHISGTLSLACLSTLSVQLTTLYTPFTSYLNNHQTTMAECSFGLTGMCPTVQALLSLGATLPQPKHPRTQLTIRQGLCPTSIRHVGWSINRPDEV
jgi:hypothetical protein